MDGREPDEQPQVQGASRGKGENDDAGRAGADGERTEPTNEYGANAKPDEEGHPSPT